MTKPNIILLGAGGHCKACIDVIEQNGGFHITGLIGRAGELNNEYFGYKVLGDDKHIPALLQENKNAFVALGHIENASKRVSLYDFLIKLGFQVPVVVAPTAYVSCRASLGQGTIVMHNAVINAGASIGKNCIINSKALIEHGSIVSDHCHISTGAILNGGVSVGTGSFVGSGSIIKEGISVGQNCLVGMGLSVRNDLPAGTIFTG